MPETLRRVLMTGDTVGGVWTFTLDLARALAPHGVEVTLAAMGGEANAAQREAAAAIPNLRLFSSPYKLEWMDDPWEEVQASRAWVLDLEEQLAPDLIHLNTYAHGSIAFRAPVMLTAHSCVLSWWNAVKPEPIPARWSRYRGEVECALKAARLVTAPSHAMLRMLEQTYGSDLPACRVIPNGRSAEHYAAAAKEPFILSAGRLWDAAKNVSAVVRAASSLPWPVFVAGENRDPSGRSVELTGCRSLGWLSENDLASWYARASIYALPARYEPFGLSALEAALSGCALVLGDISSLREIWQGAAVFVAPDDEVQLEAELRSLIRDVSRRQTLARRALSRARAFTPQRMAQEYLDAYEWLSTPRSVACAL